MQADPWNNPAHSADGRRSAPDAPTTAKVRHLAQVFAREPELILACLHGLHQEPPAKARVILAAARLAAAEYPEFADLLYCAAQAAVAAEEYGTAEVILNDALGLNPEYKDALILAARVALLRGQPQRAVAHLERAVAAGADYPDVHVLLGNAHRQQGRLRQARAAYVRALELNGNLRAAQTALAALPPNTDTGKGHELPA